MNETALNDIRKLCYKYYSRRTLAHALKVEEYITNESLYLIAPEDVQYQMRAVALAHDLFEDTKCDPKLVEEINTDCANQIKELTHESNVEYIDYINSIFSDDKDIIVKLVKMCDMKDHLMRKETLTEKLERKYKPALKVIYNYFSLNEK